jgi:LPS export ABC transporter protein LptC
MAIEARPRMIERMPPVMRRWQTWGWIFIGVGLLTPAAPNAALDNEMVMHGIAAQGQHGHSGWKFEAASSEISPDGYTTTYHNVRNATFLRDGKPAYRLTANVVTVDSRNQNYSASGGVHVWSTTPTLPEELQTENAYWDQSSQTLTCTTATRFVYHGTVMHTTHMTVNMKTGASQLGDTSIDYTKPPASPTPSVSVAPLPQP